MIDIKPLDFPAYGDRITLTRYSEGSAHTGDLANPELVATGTVIETPRSGSAFLMIETDRPAEGALSYSPTDPEEWSITPERITLSPRALWQWTIEPAKPEAAVITAVVDLRGVPVEQIELVLRGSLRQMGCTLIPHTFGPDVDTVADCAGVDKVLAIEIV
ncbi:hypothetical protein AB0F17_28765 [Nonomuraea sp. NPDC026600]|uniref:hypothetical protein n=1 Tax=Nonomuraea sp. NPDC026600 TaxID=3155363 RepID=UPI0033C36850